MRPSLFALTFALTVQPCLAQTVVYDPPHYHIRYGKTSVGFIGTHDGTLRDPQYYGCRYRSLGLGISMHHNISRRLEVTAGVVHARIAFEGWYVPLPYSCFPQSGRYHSLQLSVGARFSALLTRLSPHLQIALAPMLTAKDPIRETMRLMLRNQAGVGLNYDISDALNVGFTASANHWLPELEVDPLDEFLNIGTRKLGLSAEVTYRLPSRSICILPHCERF